MSIQPQPDAGAWISGPMEDPPPEFNPTGLVFLIVDLLAESGIVVKPNAAMIHSASLAAGDLLRALHVAPVNTPQRRP